MAHEPKRRHSTGRKGKRRSSIKLEVKKGSHKLSNAKKRKLI